MGSDEEALNDDCRLAQVCTHVTPEEEKAEESRENAWNGCLVTDANPVILSQCAYISLARTPRTGSQWHAAASLGSLALLLLLPPPQQQCCVTSGECGDIRGFKVCPAAHEQVFVNSQHLLVHLLCIRPRLLPSVFCLVTCRSRFGRTRASLQKIGPLQLC